MGSLLVVHAPIVLDDDVGFGDRKEDFGCQTLVSETAMKAFDEAILPRAARLDIKRLDSGGSAPILHAWGDKFRAIIRANKRRCAPDLDQVFKRIQHLLTGDRARRINDQTLPSIFIHHRQHLHRSPVGGLSKNKIPRPDVAGIRRLHRIALGRPRASMPVPYGSYA